jgi:hypothetical protein
VPRADRDIGAAIRDAIDGRDLLGEYGWVAKSRVGDHRPERDSLRDRGEPAERRPRIEEQRFRCGRIHIVVEKQTGPSPGRLDEAPVVSMNRTSSTKSGQGRLACRGRKLALRRVAC